MQEIRKYHNAIVERLVKAVPQTLETKFLDQTVPGCDSFGRPDVVILDDKDKKAFLVDVAVPCETLKNLKASRARKLDKYAGIKAKLDMTLFLTRCLLGLSGHGTKKTTLCWGNLALVASIRPCSKNCVAVMLLP